MITTATLLKETSVTPVRRHSLTAAAILVAAWCTTCACAGDCNGNGVDDCDDIEAGLEDSDNDGLLDSCERAVGDVNLDGAVDGADLGILLGSWGPTQSPPEPGSCVAVPLWATLIELHPDPAIVTNEALRAAIAATGLAWRVRDNSSNIEMLLVPPGTFTMGCSASDTFTCSFDENPTHPVTITQPFYMGRYEVTQAQWVAELGSNPSNFQSYADSPSRPVEQVSWNMIQPFLTQNGLRLPTEAQWEYAYRAGTTTAFHNGSSAESTLNTIAWYLSNSDNQTHAVGGKSANALGLHDMSGNVQEYCKDWYSGTYYSASPVYDPEGPTSGSYRPMRGGSWGASSYGSRASARNYGNPNYANSNYGFRVVKNP